VNLEEARKIVFDAKPRFGELFDTYKDKAWALYIKENYPTHFEAPKNFSELKSVLENILSPLLGNEKAKHTIESLETKGFVSSADHTGLLCHPFFANSALIRKSLFPNDSVICFTSGGISPTNSSLPRYVYFHDKNLEEVKIPLVSLHGRRRSVYGLPAFSEKRIRSIIDSIKNLHLSPHAASRLEQFFCSVLKNDLVFKQTKYSDQLIILNDMFWEMLFGKTKSNLVYIEIERIVRDLLLSIHLDSESLVYKVLFDEKVRNAYLENFDGQTGAHNLREETGTHLFWYIDEEEQTRVQLFLKENALQSKDGEIKIDLKPESLRKHLENYTLLPSMALCYSIISFYYGITLGGGFGQIKYLGEIKDAWRKTAEVLNEEIIDTRSDIFSGGLVLTGISNRETIKPASLFDALIYTEDREGDHYVRQEFAEEKIQKAIEESKIGDTLDALLDDIVAIIEGEKPSIEDLKIHKTFLVN